MSKQRGRIQIFPAKIKVEVIHWLNAAAGSLGFKRQIDQLKSFNCVQYNQDTRSDHFTSYKGVENPEPEVCKVD